MHERTLVFQTKSSVFVGGTLVIQQFGILQGAAVTLVDVTFSSITEEEI